MTLTLRLIIMALRRKEMTLTLRLIIMDPTTEGDDSNPKIDNNGPYARGLRCMRHQTALAQTNNIVSWIIQQQMICSTAVLKGM